MGFEIVGRMQEKWIPTEQNSSLSQRAQHWKYENVWDICWNNEFLKENNMKFVENRYFEDFVFYYKGIIRAKTYKVASFVTHIYTTFKSDSMTASVSEQKLARFIHKRNTISRRNKKYSTIRRKSRYSLCCI